MQTFPHIDGALLIDKPAGPTSHDIVDFVRRHFGVKKAGHCGTLDPGATGLLVLLLGKATKLAESLIAEDKIYEGALKFGETTNTRDADGEVEETLPVPELTLEQLNETAQSFVGDQMQMPPMVSAIKKDGVPLYKLARKGIEVERKERFIHIYSFKFSAYSAPIADFRVACTKGTYVRSLAHDFGQKLGCGAHLKALHRSVSGSFDVKNAIPYERLVTLEAEEAGKAVIPFFKLVEQVKAGRAT